MSRIKSAATPVLERTGVLVDGHQGEALAVDGHLVLVLFHECFGEIPTWLDSTQFRIRKFRRDGIPSNEYFEYQA